MADFDFDVSKKNLCDSLNRALVDATVNIGIETAILSTGALTEIICEVGKLQQKILHQLRKANNDDSV